VLGPNNQAFLDLTRPAPWHDTPSRCTIPDFVAKVTRGSDALPPETRIAVFDNDGTLWCEPPMYVQAAFAINRLRALAPSHPEWKTQQPFTAFLSGDMRAVAAGGMPAIEKLVVATHAGMTTNEFARLSTEWIGTAKHPRFKRPYTECVYQPMLELLAYLRDNGITKPSTATRWEGRSSG
jgi:haloacid dehalogenase-like hydrolase